MKPDPSVGVLGILFALGTGLLVWHFSRRPPSLAGQWRLDAAESRTIPGRQLPKWLVIDIAQDDQRGFRWSVSEANAKGRTDKLSYAAAMDGRFHPLIGAPVPTLVSFTRNPDGGFRSVRAGRDGTLLQETCRLSDDDQVLRCSGTAGKINARPQPYFETLRRTSWRSFERRSTT